MKKLIAMILLTVVLVAAAGCGEQGTQNATTSPAETQNGNAPAGDIVAQVDDKTIDLKTFEGAYKMVEMSYIKQYGGDIMERDINGRKLGDIIKGELLTSLVDEILVIDKLTAEDFTVEDAAVDENYQQFKEFVCIDEAKLAELSEQGIDEAFIKNRIRMQMYLVEFNQRVNDAVVQTVDLDAPEIASEIVKVEAQHILVETLDEANAVLDRLEAGEAFEDLAKELSKDPGSGANGGSLGEFGRGVMVAPFEAAAFALEEGAVSEPVETQFGFHVIKLNKKISVADLKALEDGQAELEAVKRQKAEAKFAEAIEGEMAALRDGRTIKEFPENIVAVGQPSEAAQTEATEASETEAGEVETTN